MNSWLVKIFGVKMLNLNGVSSMCRGAFIVFEGCDRCGKTTQSKLLVEFLQKQGVRVQHMAFPARQSNIGKVINSYLTNKQDIPDECIHLLFTANRWEFKNEMKSLLEAGTTLVVDRYCYSGVAYSTAKGFNYDWCMAPERGLIRPDLVFYLKTSMEALAARGNYGEERYEKLAFQKKVADVFNRICEEESSYWHVLDAMQEKEALSKNIREKTSNILKTIANTPLQIL